MKEPSKQKPAWSGLVGTGRNNPTNEVNAMSLNLKSNDSTESEGSTLRYEDCFEILSNHRRRYLLHYLEQNGGSANLNEVAQQIAAWENDVDIEEVTYDERKRVYTSLQQVHLPRMDKMGIVAFNDQSGIIKTGPAAAELDIYLRGTKRHNVPWDIFYCALALLNLGVIGMVGFLGPVVGINSGAWLAVFCVSTFLITATVHIYIARYKIRYSNDSKPPELAD